MEKLRKAVVAFFVFNCLSLAVFACAGSVTINGTSCGYTTETAGYCFYSCPNGGQYSEPKKKTEIEEVPSGT